MATQSPVAKSEIGLSLISKKYSLKFAISGGRTISFENHSFHKKVENLQAGIARMICYENLTCLNSTI